MIRGPPVTGANVTEALVKPWRKSVHYSMVKGKRQVFYTYILKKNILATYFPTPTLFSHCNQPYFGSEIIVTQAKISGDFWLINQK